MALVIDKGIPVPENRGRPTGELRALLNVMEIGDSVLVPGERVKASRSTVTYVNKKTEKRFITRPEGDKKVRIWRTE